MLKLPDSNQVVNLVDRKHPAVTAKSVMKLHSFQLLIAELNAARGGTRREHAQNTQFHRTQPLQQNRQ